MPNGANTQSFDPTFSPQGERLMAETLFNSIGDGAITTDEFGRITRINTTALKILGFKEHEVLGAWFPSKIIAVTEDGRSVNLIDRAITKAFLVGRAISEKAYYLKKNGQKIPLDVTVSPIIMRGKPIGALEVFRDKTMEYEIDRMKSEFITLASHQLRTPLTAIKTYTHMIVDGYVGTISPAQKKSMQTIISATNRMNELISTLLNVTRIESGSVEIAAKEVNVEKIIQEVRSEHLHLASEKKIRLEYNKLNQASPLLNTDTLLLKEVLANLITNAIKYTPQNGKIMITLRPSRQGILISVQDTGFGIPKYSQDQIFTKFYRASNALKQETTGIGLGLYLVKGLVKQLGGKIWFESQENKGTSFFLALPKTAPTKKVTPVD